MLFEDPLTSILRGGLVGPVGESPLVELRGAMVDDGVVRALGEGVPLCMFRLGSVLPERLAKLQAAGDVPVLHSGRYYPDYDAALRVGVRALVAAVGAAAGR
jgi:hypothetical protein